MKILFFARLRDALGREYLELADEACPPRVAELRALIQEQASGEFAEAMADANVFCAVNQRVVSDDHALHVSDEVAFFPPMTGG